MSAPRLAYCAETGRLMEAEHDPGGFDDSIAPEMIAAYARRGRRLRAAAFVATIEGLGQALSKPYRALRAYQRKRRALGELRALPDRMLRDIGIGRSDIAAVVEGLWSPRQSSNGYRVRDVPVIKEEMRKKEEEDDK